MRELRDLTRDRAQLVHEASRVANRIQKVLEDANLKLTQVISDIVGVSGSAVMLTRPASAPFNINGRSMRREKS